MWISLAVLLAEALVGATSFATAQSVRSPESPVTSPALSSRVDATPAESIASAVRTLSDGDGPADGSRVDCQVGSSGESGTCSSSSTSTLGSGPAYASSASSPPASYGAVMVYDAADGYVVLFGGSANGGTWTFLNGTWTDLELSASASPPERTASSMVYDAADDEIVLFGGEHSGSSIYTTTYFNDTWVFRAGTWTNITRPMDAPPRRYGDMMAYDAADGYVVMFGGNYERSFYNDTWEFLDGNWTNLSSDTPAADTPSCRFGASGAYDASAGYVVMFGGVGKRAGEGCGMSVLNSSAPGTWAFEGGSWKSLSPTESPPALWGASMSYDPEDGAVVLFGGIGPGDVAMDDTWEFSSGQWSELSLLLYPVSRFSASMTYDTADGYVLLYGGLSEPEPDAPLLSDVWTFSDGAWLNLTSIPSPPASTDLSLAYDAKDGYVLLFDSDPTGSAAETWRFVGGTWLKLTPPESPPPLEGASLTYDASTSGVLLFGGLDGSTLSDATWSFARGNWTNLTKKLDADPPARYDAGMAYDTAAETVVLFGGVGASGYLNDTWTYAHGNWTEISPETSPSPRADMSLAYDAATKVILLFGGESTSGPMQDTWEFSSGNWTQLAPGTAPPAREGAAFVDDSTDGYMLLFGGTGSAGPLNDTWAYGGGSWTNISPAVSPGLRSGAGIAFDVADGVVVLFGGEVSAGPLNDTWDYVAGVWTQLFPYHRTTSPGEFSIRFTESGLPSGTEWWVNVTAGPTEHSTSSAILFTEPNGSYAYEVASADKTYFSMGGTFTVAGAAIARTLEFAPVTYEITFTETGLPTGSAWWVNLTQGASFGSDTATILFNESNGSYAYSVATSDKSYSAQGGTIAVEGTALSEPAGFSLVQYEVTIVESGLPSGTEWWINLTGGASYSSTTPTVLLREPNGTDTYSVATTNKSFFSPPGTFTVAGLAVSEQAEFAPVTFGVTVTEGGLPAGTPWWINLTGGATFHSTTEVVSFNETNGTYAYTLATTDQQYAAAAGEFTVDGGAVGPAVTFVQVSYTVTFVETGLPPGTTWMVVFDGQTTSSSASSIAFDEPNGSYGYSVGSVSGFSASSSSGQVEVKGTAQAVWVTFDRTSASSNGASLDGLPVGDWIILGVAVIAVAAAGTLLTLRGRSGGRRGGGGTSGVAPPVESPPSVPPGQ